MYDLNTPSGVLEHVQNNCVSMVEFIGILPIFLCCLSGRNKDVLQLKLITFIKAIILEFEAKYPPGQMVNAISAGCTHNHQKWWK